MSAPRFFDIHAHVNDASFDEDRSAVIARMQEKNVWAIMVGTDLRSSQEVATMASFTDEGIYSSIGVHPIDDRDERFNGPFFAELAVGPKVVAVGECGLDYSRLSDARDVLVEKARQKELFEVQVDFALAQNLPLMIHCRDSDKKIGDAHRDVLEILHTKKNIGGQRLRGNVHFFTQTIDIAREYFALDFTISLTGVITFSNEYDELVRQAPLDKIMSETDSPYASPTPYRGKRNEPIYVEEIVKKIAELRGEDFEFVRSALVENALRVFNITV